MTPGSKSTTHTHTQASWELCDILSVSIDRCRGKFVAPGKFFPPPYCHNVTKANPNLNPSLNPDPNLNPA